VKRQGGPSEGRLSRRDRHSLPFLTIILRLCYGLNVVVVSCSCCAFEGQIALCHLKWSVGLLERVKLFFMSYHTTLIDFDLISVLVAYLIFVIK